jgi:hypothetical protein
MMPFQSLQENLVRSYRKIIKSFVRLKRRLGNRIENRPGGRRAGRNKIIFWMCGISLAKSPQRLIFEQSKTMQIVTEPERYAIVIFAKRCVVQIQSCGRRD